ncbi:MAG: arylsulfatase [Planctomycetota bacterium]
MHLEKPVESSAGWRRALLKYCLMAAAAAGALQPEGVLADSRPNFVFILADDVGYGDLGCFGQTNFATPRLDQMASEGMRLTQHYCGSTVCAPSRACLLAGRHTGRVFQRTNGPHHFRDDPLDPTIAGHLRAAGYHTALIGKSGLSCIGTDGGLVNRKGFDYFFGYTSHGNAHRYYPPYLWRNDEKVFFPGNHGKQGDAYSGDLFRAEAMAYLEQRSAGEEPFFLHLSLQQSHADLAVPEAYRQRFLGKFDEPERVASGQYRHEANPKATYAAMMTYLDESVGQVLDKLRELGLAENTLVVFASDNGAMSEGGWSREHFNSSGPLRGGKRDLYEGGIRSPTIAWWPGRVPAGSESEHVSAFWDFAPTACELAGVSPMAETDGISYAPTLLGRSDEQRQHEYLYWEFYEQGGRQAVRLVGREDGAWKGVRLGVAKDPRGPVELYNLRQDPAEKRNVADQFPGVVAAVIAAMDDAHVESPVVKFAKKKAKAKKKVVASRVK